MTVDVVGNLYAADVFLASDSRGEINVFPPGSSSPAYTIGPDQGVDTPSAMTLDSAGNLYEANYYDGNSAGTTVNEYAAGTSNLVRSITDGIASPNELALDGTGRLYVGNSWNGFAGGDLTVYDTSSGALLQTIDCHEHVGPGLIVAGK
jgi:hypothetical protein